MKPNLQHLAIIMDGNARWAMAKGLSSTEGYKKGAERVKKLIEVVIEHNISYLTLYAFSYENWQRSRREVSFIINLFNSYLSNEAESLNKNNIKLKVIGHLNNIDKYTKQRIVEAVELTKHNNKMTLCLAFSYSSKLEIVDAYQKIIDAKLSTLSVNDFKQYLYDPEMPDVDLLIRTGNVLRISNFLLWQSAYAELFFTKKYWPDFDREDLVAALADYSTRKRTFGGRSHA